MSYTPYARTIKSLQYFTIAITNGNGSNTATITSVDTTKTVIHLLGHSTADNNATYPGTRMGYLTLTNATTVTATRGTTVDGLTISGVAVEHY